MSRDPALHTWTYDASDIDEIVQAPPPWDALSDPSNDDLLGGALTFWPPGSAFGSGDGTAVSLSSVLARLTRALLSPFETLYARAYRLAIESSVFGANELLLEWEIDYGLPDSCGSGTSSIAERLRALQARVASTAVITPGDFIRVAASYGFTIAIEEPCIFQCAFSECGGEHEIGDTRQEAFWIVYVADLAIDYFRASEGECGRDPLFSLGDAERLICILRRIAPAWTVPILSIDALRPAFDPPAGAEWLYLSEAYPRQYITVDGEFVYAFTDP